MAKCFLLIPIIFHCCILVNGQNIQKDKEIEIRVLSDLGFGSFVVGDTGGTVIISSEGNRTVTAPVIGLANADISAAEIEITAQGRPWIQINISEPAYLYHSGGKGSMEIINFTTDKPTNPFRTSGGNKSDIVRVGATLNVLNRESNPPGNYRGTFSVTLIEQ